MCTMCVIWSSGRLLSSLIAFTFTTMRFYLFGSIESRIVLLMHCIYCRLSDFKAYFTFSHCCNGKYISIVVARIVAHWDMANGRRASTRWAEMTPKSNGRFPWRVRHLVAVATIRHLVYYSCVRVAPFSADSSMSINAKKYTIIMKRMPRETEILRSIQLIPFIYDSLHGPYMFSL